MSRFKLFLLGIFGAGSLLVVSGFNLGTTSAEDIRGNLCNGAELSLSTDKGCDTVDKKCESNGKQVNCQEKRANSLLTQIINIFSLIVGIVAVLMIVYGGFRYITSGGDSGNVGTAKNTIIYAIVGLIIVALAQFIVRFILSKATQ